MARGDGSMIELKNKKTGPQVDRHGEPVWRVRFIDRADGKQREREVTASAAAEMLLIKDTIHSGSLGSSVSQESGSGLAAFVAATSFRVQRPRRGSESGQVRGR
jgi:hypothetical protein